MKSIALTLAVLFAIPFAAFAETADQTTDSTQPAQEEIIVAGEKEAATSPVVTPTEETK